MLNHIVLMGRLTKDPELRRHAQQLVDENRRIFGSFYKLV